MNLAEFEKDYDYAVKVNNLDGDAIKDVVITLKDKKEDKVIGEIGLQAVMLYSDPNDTWGVADSWSEDYGNEVGFLLKTEEVKRFYKERGYWTFNHIGWIYQFDLLPEYQGKGLEECLLCYLGRLIQEKKKNIFVLGATIFIADKGNDVMFERFMGRKRKVGIPVNSETFSNFDFIDSFDDDETWYTYVIWGHGLKRKG